jgi:exodeoxyribonuclease VII large subunit
VFHHPLERVQLLERQLDELQARAQRGIGRRAEIASSLLGAKARQLESLSPLAVLGRGYSLTSRLDDGRLVRSASQLTVGDQLRTRLSEGALTSRVETIEPV